MAYRWPAGTTSYRQPHIISCKKKDVLVLAMEILKRYFLPLKLLEDSPVAARHQCYDNVLDGGHHPTSRTLAEPTSHFMEWHWSGLQKKPHEVQMKTISYWL
jgi:hypothetical protein